LSCGAPPGTGSAYEVSRPAIHVPAADVSAYRFPPAQVSSGLGLSRKGWLAIGVSGAVTVLAVAAFLLLRPPPPSPQRTVEAYFAALGSANTAAALALVDTGGSITPDAAPLLVPAALADAANRPAEATVTSATPDATGRFTMVAVTYKVAGQPIDQIVAVETTGDQEKPYLLVQPFLTLSIQMPYRLATTVNGIEIPSDSVVQGTLVFPGAYQATTTGNALFAGATQTATYQDGSDAGVFALIDFGQPAFAPGASGALQTMTQQLLDTKCLNLATESYSYDCPFQAPYRSYDQTTTWKITSYPQIQLLPPNPGQTAVQFTTDTPGSAAYTIKYTDWDGTARTESDTVPINIGGYAEVLDDGTMQVVLGY